MEKDLDSEIRKNIDLDPSWSLTILISKTDERMDGEKICKVLYNTINQPSKLYKCPKTMY